MKSLRIFILLSAICCMLPSVAQTRVSLLTASPGSAIYELDGHTGLRIANDSLGYDQVINWGLFDFESPNFVYRFVKGETDYMCGAVPAEYFINSYLRDGRTVTEQILDLTPAQTERLTAMIRENLLPGNRVYRYNYVKDNCATRPLNMIEAATGRRFEFGDTLSGITYRDEMRFNHRYYPWYQFGIDLALGSGLDYELTPRETAFSPLRLQKLMSSQLIVSETHVHGTESLHPSPTPWWLSPDTVCWIIFTVVLALTMADLRRKKVNRVLDTILYSAFGLIGCLVAFLIFVSVHEATSPNWLLAWVNPLCFLGAVLPWIKSAKKTLICYHFANFAVLILLLLCREYTGQVFNQAFIPLILTDLTRSGAVIYICRKN